MKKIIFYFLFLIQPILAAAEEEEEISEKTYDPFYDYSDYEQTTEEEADIYFFRYGRMVSTHLNLGYRGFTQTLEKLYKSDLTYGLTVTYFFDMRLSAYASFLVGDHEFRLTTQNGVSTGNVSLSFLSLGLKNYLNTELLIWPLSSFRPYFLFGFNQTYRSLKLSDYDESSRDDTLGLEFGTGIEIPIFSKTSYMGFQIIYRHFTFIDENQLLIDPISLLPLEIKPSGDAFDFSIILGFSF